MFVCVIDWGVVKGCLLGYQPFLCRFCEDNFVSEMETTIGVDFYLSEINLDGKKIKVSPDSTLTTSKHTSTHGCRSKFGTQQVQRSTCQFQQFTTEKQME